MRIEIAHWVSAGWSDGEILDTYVRRYGSKVLVDPRTAPGWWTPWVPWLAVIFATGLVFWLLRRWRAKALATPMRSIGPDLVILPDLDD
jgi:cytochrome c-type biogenesis protein CcmH/NrfF